MKDPFALGDAVRQVVPVIQGSVTDTRYEPQTRSFQSFVQWTDADGETHSRWFDDKDLEAVEAA